MSFVQIEKSVERYTGPYGGARQRGRARVVVTAPSGRAATYDVFVFSSHAVVVAEPANPRHFGRTFHYDEGIAQHYRRHGDVLAEAVAELRRMMAEEE